jgi:hypothetical protein
VAAAAAAATAVGLFLGGAVNDTRHKPAPANRPGATD